MQQAMRVMQTVILAAGSGSRLAPPRGDVPKPLMNVAGMPLVALVDQFYERVQARGGGRWDTSSLIQPLQKP